jgi:hypothetical protein
MLQLDVADDGAMKKERYLLTRLDERLVSSGKSINITLTYTYASRWKAMSSSSLGPHRPKNPMGQLVF